jgi:hypothetical protein
MKLNKERRKESYMCVYDGSTSRVKDKSLEIYVR